MGDPERVAYRVAAKLRSGEIPTGSGPSAALCLPISETQALVRDWYASSIGCVPGRRPCYKGLPACT